MLLALKICGVFNGKSRFFSQQGTLYVPQNRDQSEILDRQINKISEK